MNEQSTTPPTATRVRARKLEIPSALSVQQLAQAMDVNPIDVIKQLMRNGIMANINHVLDFPTATLIARAFGFIATDQVPTESGKSSIRVHEEESENLVVRPPVVAILGHVDHGKTTLLDAVRKTNVVDSEVGGITQHIGAYQIKYKDQLITFLDTPGHEAFTAMRARGAQVTDIAVLVVAADDGVMPQTAEAINHVKAAEVPIVVAINKIDLPGADLDKVRRQLMENDLIVEEWGGEVIAVPVSAKSNEGIDDLLENLLVVAEVADLKANPDRNGVGVVVESRLDKSRGPVATILIQTGTLYIGSYLVAGQTWGRVKAMFNEAGTRVDGSGPSTPVEVLGLNSVPDAGDRVMAVENERSAREIVTDQKIKEENRAGGRTFEDVVAQIRAGTTKELNIILKTDVQGSIEAVRSAIDQVGTEESQVKVLHAAAGSITESDVLLASASEAIIVAFNTRIEPGARRLADSEGVDIRFYSIIYRLSEDIQIALKGLVEPTYKDVLDGRAEVRATFSLGRRSWVAGCSVLEGRITRGSQIRLVRDGKTLFDGTIRNLRRFKDDVREVSSGYECGITLNGFDDFQEGDILEAHSLQTT